MPTLICSFCEYVCQGEHIFDMERDGLKHEKKCKQNPSNWGKN